MIKLNIFVKIVQQFIQHCSIEQVGVCCSMWPAARSGVLSLMSLEQLLRGCEQQMQWQSNDNGGGTRNMSSSDSSFQHLLQHLE